MDHLAKQKNFLIRIFFQRLVTDLDRILNAVAKSEMTGDIKSYRTEVKEGRRKILLSKILRSSQFFDLSGNGGSVIRGDVKLFNGSGI
jgi:hypothetical protein